MSRRPNGTGALRALGAVMITFAALITSTAGAAAAPASDEDYTCVEEVEVCVAAGLQAGGSAQRAEQYLRDYTMSKATAQPAGQFAAAIVGAGYLINPGPLGRRYYGWRLSRSIAQGDRIKLYRCRLLNGRPVNCRYIGDIGVQAEYFLRNRYVSDIETKVFNLMGESFGVRHSAICFPPSSECIPQPGFFGALSAGGSSTANYRDFQLTARGGYWMSFQWEIDDPVTRTRALTAPRGSMSFGCGPYNPPTNPGDCFFDARNPGGNH